MTFKIKIEQEFKNHIQLAYFLEKAAEGIRTGKTSGGYWQIVEPEYTYKITQDNCLSNNPAEWDWTDVFLVTTENRHFEVLRDGFDVSHITDYLSGEIDDDSNLKYQDYHIFPLRAYIHSGIALSLSSNYPFDCQFDSGQIGYVLVKKTNEVYNDGNICKWVNVDITDALKCAESIVETYNQYLQGEVYQVNVYKDGEAIDSLGGIFGYQEAEKEALDIINHYKQQDNEI